MSTLTKREQSALCCVQTLCEAEARARLDKRDKALAAGKPLQAIQFDGEANALLDAAETLGWLHYPQLTPAIAGRSERLHHRRAMAAAAARDAQTPPTATRSSSLARGRTSPTATVAGAFYTSPTE